MNSIKVLVLRVIYFIVPRGLKTYIKSKRFLKNILGRNSKYLNKSPSSVTQQFVDSIKRFKVHTLVISHSNFYESLGGVERVVFEQVMAYEEQSIGTVHIFSTFTGNLWDQKPTNKFGLSVDGSLIGYFNFSEIRTMLELFDFHSFAIHHLLNWPMAFVNNLVGYIESKGVEKEIFLHDFYLLCPTINLSCLNATDSCFRSQCGLVGAENKCEKQISKKAYDDWVAQCHKLLLRFENIYAPSDFLADVFNDRLKDGDLKIKVWELLKLTPLTESRGGKKNEKIRIAYLGYKADIKGWKTWEALVKNRRLIKDYEFYVIGEDKCPLANTKCIGYDFMKDGPGRVMDILKSESIDIVLLWSIVPESYSFTYHEAKSSGCIILTNTSSGNIYRKVAKSKNSYEKYFHSEAHLQGFLYNIKEVAELISLPKIIYRVESNTRENTSRA